MKVTRIDCIDGNDRIYFKGKAWKWLTAPKAGEVGRYEGGGGTIDGLQMTLHPGSGIINLDVPGFSKAVHLSGLAVELEPAIQAPEIAKPAPAPSAYVEPKKKPTKAEKAAAKAAADEAHGYDTAGDDLDDAEIAKLAQSPKVKAKLEKAAKKRGRPPKVKEPEPIEDDGDDEDGEGGDE